MDSWIETYATRLRAEVGEMWTVLFPSVQRQQSITRLYRSVGPQELEHLACVTGTDLETVSRTLPIIDGDLAEVAASSRQRSARSILGHSRWCPACLAERNGRWRTSWRQPLVVACPQHGTMLLELCSACGQAPRQRFTHRNIPKPGCCGERDHRSDIRSGPRVPTCGADLSAHPVVPANQQLLRAQLVLLSVSDLAQVGDADAKRRLGDAWLVVRQRSSDPSSPGQLGLIADALEDAAAIVEFETRPPGLVRLGQQGLGARPAPVPAGLSKLSDPARAALIKVRDPHLRKMDRLRHASATDAPISRPVKHAGSVASFATRLPSLLWPETTLFLRSILGGPTPSIRTHVPLALLLAGTARSQQHLIDDSGGRLSGDGFQYAFTTWCAQRDTTRVLAAISDLAARLRAAPPPIDYARREQLMGSTQLLDRPGWLSLTDTAGVSAGEAKRLMFANAYLYELVTCGHPGNWGPTAALADSSYWGDYRRFCLQLGDELAQAFRQWAQDWLDRNGLEEPLTWAPQEYSALPSMSFVRRAWTEVSKESQSPGQAAEALGVDLEHLRMTLMARPRCEPPSSSARSIRLRLNGPLGHATLVDRLQNGESVRQIAQQLGYDRKTIRAALQEHRLAVPSPGRHAAAVDRAWLFEQYWACRRPLPDIALEIGMSPTNLARRAKSLGVPLRQRGGLSHALPFSNHEPPPPPLRDALVGQRAVQRLQRFCEIAIDGNFSNTASRIGVPQSVLSTQLKKLETATGLRLIARDRPGPGVVHELTTDGRLLLAQYKAWIRGASASSRRAG